MSKSDTRSSDMPGDMYYGMLVNNQSGEIERISTVRAVSKFMATHKIETDSPTPKGFHLTVRRYYPSSLVRSPCDIERDRKLERKKRSSNVQAPQYGGNRR